MLALISPAKKMDFGSKNNLSTYTQPRFLDHSHELVDTAKNLSSNQLQNLMKISEKLADLNHERFQQFSTLFTPENARPAVNAFRGDTYVGLDADTLSNDDLSYAQSHLGILSGLYGLLRPLDLMQAYRLEMGTKLSNPRGENIYDFWGEIITKACNDLVASHKDQSIISLASNEYIKAVKPKALNSPFITCHFKELKDGKTKTIGLFAKRARGKMARFIIQNRIETPEGLKKFKKDGYDFMPSLSDKKNYVFIREKP